MAFSSADRKIVYLSIIKLNRIVQEVVEKKSRKLFKSKISAEKELVFI